MKTPDDHNELLCLGRRKGCGCECALCGPNPHGKVESQRRVRRRQLFGGLTMIAGLFFAVQAGAKAEWWRLWQLAIPWVLVGCLVYWRQEAIDGVAALAIRTRKFLANRRERTRARDR
jgi:hypothetical protein